MEGHTKITSRTVEVWKEILTATGSERVYEIGFNQGHSAQLFLDLGASKVHSIDINPDCEAKMKEIADPRFSYEIISSEKAPLEFGYDLVFVDGDHSVEGIQRDLMFAQSMKAKYIVVDDWGGKWFPQIPAVTVHLCTNGIIQYDIQKVYTYDASDGENRMGLLCMK